MTEVTRGLESLKGDRAGQHSIRINDQYRICFVWREGNAYDVEIADYHSALISFYCWATDRLTSEERIRTIAAASARLREEFWERAG